MKEEKEGKRLLYVENSSRFYKIEGCPHMSRPERGLQFAKNVKIIDWLKTEILGQVANVCKGLYHANQLMIIESLSGLIIATYILARRVGFSYRELDQAVIEQLREHTREGHQLEQWYGDLSTLEEYINKR